MNGCHLQLNLSWNFPPALAIIMSKVCRVSEYCRASNDVDFIGKFSEKFKLEEIGDRQHIYLKFIFQFIRIINVVRSCITNHYKIDLMIKLKVVVSSQSNRCKIQLLYTLPANLPGRRVWDRMKRGQIDK